MRHTNCLDRVYEFEEAFTEELRENMLAFCDSSKPHDIELGGSMMRFVPATVFKESLENLIANYMGFDIKDSMCYFRLNPEDFNTNLRIHQDGLILNKQYEYAALFYLRVDGVTGTAIYESIVDEPLPQIIPEGEEHKVTQVKFILGEERKIAVYETGVYHCRFPPKGFGNTPQNCRNVIVMFFNKI